MKIYVYTQDADGNRRLAMPADEATLQLILDGAPVFNYVVSERIWESGSTDMQTGERGEDTRLITLTPAPLTMADHIQIMASVMEVEHLLRPGDSVLLA